MVVKMDSNSHCLYVKFQDNLYWAIQATECNNPQKNDLHDIKIYTEDDISEGFTHQGGWDITVELPTGNQNHILYTDCIKHPIHLQL